MATDKIRKSLKWVKDGELETDLHYADSIFGRYWASATQWGTSRGYPINSTRPMKDAEYDYKIKLQAYQEGRIELPTTEGPKTISGTEMRDRLLAKLQEPRHVVAKGRTIEEMRADPDVIRLHEKGDVRLVWVLEADLNRWNEKND